MPEMAQERDHAAQDAAASGTTIDMLASALRRQAPELPKLLHLEKTTATKVAQGGVALRQTNWENLSFAGRPN